MNRTAKYLLAFALLVIPILFYCLGPGRPENKSGDHSQVTPHPESREKPRWALIFDDLGENLNDIKQLYELGIPLTVAVIPDLKYSSNVANIAYRCGFSILVHVPMEPKEEVAAYTRSRGQFLGSHISRAANEKLLRTYLNSIRSAIGVNNHMGSKATEDPAFMEQVMERLKSKNMFFIDSRTSLDSVACEVAEKVGTVCRRNDGFLDAVDDPGHIKSKIQDLLRISRQKGEVIVIAHPRETTLTVLRAALPELKDEVEFITLAEYFRQ